MDFNVLSFRICSFRLVQNFIVVSGPSNELTITTSLSIDRSDWRRYYDTSGDPTLWQLPKHGWTGTIQVASNTACDWKVWRWRRVNIVPFSAFVLRFFKLTFRFYLLLLRTKNSSPLGFSELFNEFRLQENLHSLDDILNAIIDSEGMSFNDLKPIYKEFLLKLAVTLTKDELYQRSKSIMRRQKKKLSRRKKQSAAYQVTSNYNPDQTKLPLNFFSICFFSKNE